MNAPAVGLAVVLVAALLAIPGASILGAEPASNAPGLAAALDAIEARLDALDTSIWYAVDRAAVRALLETDRAALERELGERRPDLAVLLARLNLHLRAGHRSKARGVLQALCQRDDFLKRPVSSDVASTLVAREEWDLAVELLRSCPTAMPGGRHLVIQHVAQTEGDAAADALLQYLASAGRQGWMHAWISFRAARGGADEILQRLATGVREERASLARAEAYLQAVAAEGTSRDVNWMGQVCRPKLAADSYSLGRGLMSAKAFPAAITLLERSLSMETTDEDALRVGMTVQALPRNTDPICLLRAWTEQALVEAYRAVGRADLARPHVESLAKIEIAGRGLTPWNARLAGQVQAESGSAAAEGMVRAQEEVKAESPAYWLARANYYMGRREDKGAREAFETSLSLCPIEGREAPAEGEVSRWRVLESYVWFLRDRKSMAEAAALLRRELGQARPESETRRRALLRLVEIDYAGHATIDPRDDLLWGVLAATPRWDHSEQRCLVRMMENGTVADREAVMARAERLCANADPSRAKTIGCLCSRYSADERALPLLHDAVARLSDDRERGWAALELFQAYLDLARAAEAEAHFPSAMAEIDPRSVPELLSRMALVAAKQGDTARAFQVWRRVANVDATEMDTLSAIANAGLKEDLRRFYETWQKSDRASWVPGEALSLLSDM